MLYIDEREDSKIYINKGAILIETSKETKPLINAIEDGSFINCGNINIYDNRLEIGIVSFFLGLTYGILVIGKILGKNN